MRVFSWFLQYTLTDWLVVFEYVIFYQYAHRDLSVLRVFVVPFNEEDILLETVSSDLKGYCSFFFSS